MAGVVRELIEFLLIRQNWNRSILSCVGGWGGDGEILFGCVARV